MAIQISHVSKKYFIAEKEEKFDTFGQKMISLLKSPFRNFKELNQVNHVENAEGKNVIWALRDVTLEVKEGEILGIIGRNGAGKSTLLKILSRITDPTSGEIKINGRVAALLEVGTGFHPDLSGRENIYLNGTILGMKKQEVDSLLDQIIDFSGIELFIDTPIKKYSSGMKLRLGFAVAAHLQPEILIIDEILAVGDAAFQQKCIGRINEVARNGRTVLFVSHNMGAIKNLCKRTICLQNGQISMDGNSDEVVSKYLSENLTQESSLNTFDLQSRIERVPTNNAAPSVLMQAITIYDIENRERKEFFSDEEILIATRFEVLKTATDLRIITFLVDGDNNIILSSQASDNAKFVEQYSTINPGTYEATVKVPQNMLGGNEYFVSVHIVHPYVEHLLLTKALSFQVKFKGYNNIQTGTFSQAWVKPMLDWEVKKSS